MLAENGTEVVDPIWVPVSNTMLYEVVHVQVPMFLSRHVLVNVAFGSNLVPSGTVTSETNCARSVHVCAARALAGRTAAGMSESTMAINNSIDEASNLDFIRSSIRSFNL
jgi:hypothetical protein